MNAAGDIVTGMRVLDVGSGSGYWSGLFASKGCTCVGIEPSPSGIEVARAAYPTVRFEPIEASADMLGELNEDPFDLVVSVEVVEHLYDPVQWARGCFNALRPGGRLVLSTPYHGWLKDTVIALSGKSDFHHDALRVGGHIKFFSNKTLSRLLTAAGFIDLKLIGAGRIPYVWKSVIAGATRPE